MDGIEATQKIHLKESGTSGHMPIVAITANAFDDDRRKCFEAGMDGYVVKPVSAKAIGDEVDRVMALFNHTQAETVKGEVASDRSVRCWDAKSHFRRVSVTSRIQAVAAH